jgi:hypothetical protein
LFIIQRINQQNTLTSASTLSLSLASKVLMNHEPCLSSTGRDILLKPILFALAGTDRLRDEIEEWQTVVLDTYKKLKNENSIRGSYGGAG